MKDEPRVCYSCIGERFLREEIRSNGLKKKCQFCGKVRKGRSLKELADLVQEVIETHFQLTPSDPHSEGVIYDKEIGWERRGEPVEYLVAGLIEADQELAEGISVNGGAKLVQRAA